MQLERCDDQARIKQLCQERDALRRKLETAMTEGAELCVGKKSVLAVSVRCANADASLWRPPAPFTARSA